jgi:hypothetical protein
MSRIISGCPHFIGVFIPGVVGVPIKAIITHRNLLSMQERRKEDILDKYA